MDPTFTAPQVDADTPFTFSLVVNDGSANSAPDQVVVTIRNLSDENHFVPVCPGNGVDQMNINVAKALMDGIDLHTGDEIALYDGLLCVGAGKLVTVIDGSHVLFMKASRDDGAGNGYTTGHPIIFTYGDRSTGKEIIVVAAYYDSNNPAWSISGTYEPQATSFEEPSAFSTISININLQAGWNICSTNNLPADTGLKAVEQTLITDNKLVKIQDETGNSIEDMGIFGGWTNNIGNFKPGEGYKIKVSAADTLSIFDSYTKSSVSQASPVYFNPVTAGNGTDHMNLNLVNLPAALEPGDEIGVFDSDLCVGLIVFGIQYSVFGQSRSEIREPKSAIQNLSIPVTASDGSDMPGFTEGHPYTIKIWKSSTNQEYTTEPVILKGSSTFVKHESALVSLENLTIGRSDDWLIENLSGIRIFPNPTTGIVYIHYSGKLSEGLQVSVVNALGQQVLKQKPDANPEVIDLSGNVNGIYYLCLTGDTWSKNEIVVLTRLH